MAIVGRLTQSKCHVITELYGKAYSAASLIFACGDHRRVSKYGWFMTHESYFDISGKTSDQETVIKFAKLQEQQWAEVMSGFSQKSKKFWLSKKKDYYVGAEELKTIGVADEIF